MLNGTVEVIALVVPSSTTAVLFASLITYARLVVEFAATPVTAVEPSGMVVTKTGAAACIGPVRNGTATKRRLTNRMRSPVLMRKCIATQGAGRRLRAC